MTATACRTFSVLITGKIRDSNTHLQHLQGGREAGLEKLPD